MSNLISIIAIIISIISLFLAVFSYKLGVKNSKIESIKILNNHISSMNNTIKEYIDVNFEPDDQIRRDYNDLMALIELDQLLDYINQLLEKKFINADWLKSNIGIRNLLLRYNKIINDDYRLKHEKILNILEIHKEF
ncbi:hypothetical protein HK18_09045 [Commensalibacter intestini]|uniref:Uncharacterized protein n=1 Tax=Commensalibacter intestini TaxID=479936 RepID=A0A251ZU38_9PROT|nr:hypothetical protein [Commensalibacter intestini]OUI78186.1 hypothetical protein HK18_09045 [Commensalibacter intestini]